MSSFNFRVGGCAWCHPGGGALEYDRTGYRYDGIDGGAPGKIGPNPAAASQYGDYYVFDPGSTNPLPNQYGLVSKVGAAGKGVAEVDCLMCHLNGSYNNQARNYCMTTAGAGAAMTPGKGATMGLTRTGVVETTYDSAGNPNCDFTYANAGAGLATISQAMIVKTPKKEACGTCHFPDFSRPNGTGPAGNPLDFTTFQKKVVAGSFTDSDTGSPNATPYDLAKGRAEFGKRGLSINDPVYNPDAHMDAGMVCADCHYNVSGTFPALKQGNNEIAAGLTVKSIDHQFAKGNNRPDGKNMDQLDNTVTCESCHITRVHPKAGSAPTPTHAAFPALHFERIDCRTCHIPTINFVKKQLVADFSSAPYPMDAGFERGQSITGPAGQRGPGRIGYKPLYMWQDRGHAGTNLMLSPVAIGATFVWKDIGGQPYAKRFPTAAVKKLRGEMGGGSAWKLNSPQGGDTELIINTTDEITKMVGILKGTSGGLGDAFLMAEPALNIYVNQFTVSHNVAKKANALGGGSTGCASCHSEDSIMFANPAEAGLGDVAGWQGQVFLQPKEGGLQMTCDGGDCATGTKRVTSKVTFPCPDGTTRVVDLTTGVAHGETVKNVIPQENVLCYNALQLADLKKPQSSSYFAGLDASFTWRADQSVSLQVNLDASTSKCPSSASACGYDWDCGNNTNASGIINSCQYQAPGNYNVTLKVTDLDRGHFDTEVKAVTAHELTEPVAPEVTYTLNANALEIVITGSINRAQMYWGDGSRDNVYSSGTFPHTYPAGTGKSYTCKIYVYDTNNVKTTYTIPVSY
jgi:hypothetical protein